MSHTTREKRNFKDGLIDFTAGSLGGVALVYVGQPLDTIKVKMQTFPQLYNGMVDCAQKTIKQEGFLKGLYAGTLPAVAANVAENSVLFAGYGVCQKLVANAAGVKVDNLSTVGSATAGGIAAFFSSFSLCPTELIKCKLQAAKESGATEMGPFELTRRIFREEGVRGLFRGLGSTIVREMPGYFLFFGGYEGTRSLLAAEGQSKDDIGPIRTMMAGGVGGMVFWIVTFPADVIKSRIQVSNSDGHLISVGLNIFRKEGVGALYSGLRPTLVRTLPATATLFVTYEYSPMMTANINRRQLNQQQHRLQQNGARTINTRLSRCLDNKVNTNSTL